MLADSQLIILKLEGTKFAAQIPFLTGKTFTVLKSSMAGTAGTSKWLFLQPVGGMANAAKDVIVLKVQHGTAQLPWLVGKTFTIGQAPMVAGGNAGKYLVLHPATGLIGKGVTSVTVAAKSLGTTVNSFGATIKTVALQTAGKGTASVGAATLTAGKAVTASSIAKGAASAGTIWTGTGMSLGLGLGLGGAGPVVLGGLLVATGYAVYQLRKKTAKNNLHDSDELGDALR